MGYPGWLPALFQVSPWGDDTYEALYQLFEQDFKTSQPVYGGKPVWFFPDKVDGKEEIFLASDLSEGQRDR